ncbi:hypothetical protein L226DRAFT_608597 [Lentinus tigrinus ALCF2SS1-7]|uniref:uncharacterized protein n=1 Tax=Lentinus tigrinus ALCF2SS1-7 TaxID=1328758 RepID=UPI001165F6FB|nr:hypothetical protein L226DRAFT_608597 [Lentinus tigrinus ALCF2SS1-7]
MAESSALLTPYFPVYAPSAESVTPNILDPSISAILGGDHPVLLPGKAWPRCGICNFPLIPYIQVNVSSPQTPSEFRQKVGVRPEPGHTVIFQVLVCAEDENAACFQDAIVAADASACLVRVVQASPSAEDDPVVKATRAEIADDKFFMEARVITGWTAGRPEVVDAADGDGGEDDLRMSHAPAEGLKLLGSPVRDGPYYSTAHEGCTKPLAGSVGGDAAEPQPASEHYEWRCLLQLGTSLEEGAPLCVVGNTWINQCIRHPEVLEMVIGGDW